MKIKRGTPYPSGADWIGKDVNFSVAAPGAGEVKLVLEPDPACGLETQVIDLTQGRIGDVFCVKISELPFEKMTYYYLVDGAPTADPCGRVICGKEVWGQKPETVTCGLLRTRELPCGALEPRPEADEPTGGRTYPAAGAGMRTAAAGIPLEDTIIYRLHVRGFSMKNGKKSAGTFQGLTEKIPYLKELGITLIELMPAYDFDEIPWRQEKQKTRFYDTPELSVGVNYWGYTTADYFAPKASFSVEKTGRGAVKEFVKLVETVHAAGMELGMEFHFPDTVAPAFAVECLKYWVAQYDIDAVHISGSDEIVRCAQADPLLAMVKIFANAWVVPPAGSRRHTATYQDSFLANARRFLRGDQDTVGAMKYEIEKNPSDNGVINFLASHNTLTLADTVSYERKHNEANGEQNRDGTDYNFSSNGGVEGPTAKKSILNFRKNQIKNALAMLLFAQGTPMIMAGDEWGRTQDGNNNPYNQDNEINWISWKRNKFENDILACAKQLIRFRKEHRIFHMRERFLEADHRALGYPDISWHGETAWQYTENPADRYFAAMYFGAYAPDAGQTMPPEAKPKAASAKAAAVKEPAQTSKLYYVAYNMSGGERGFGVPSLPRKKEWHLLYATDEEKVSCDGRILTLGAHNVAVYISDGI